MVRIDFISSGKLHKIAGVAWDPRVEHMLNDPCDDGCTRQNKSNPNHSYERARTRNPVQEGIFLSLLSGWNPKYFCYLNIGPSY